MVVEPRVGKCLKLNFCDVDQCEPLFGTLVLKAGNECSCCIKGCYNIYAGLDSCAADKESVTTLITSLSRSIDYKIDLVTQDKVDDRRRFLADTIYLTGFYAVLIECVSS